MYKTILVTLCASLLFSTIGFSQLRVDSNGLVGVGSTYVNPYFNLTLGNKTKGGLIHYGEFGGIETVFRAGQSGSAATVGTNTDRIDFWYSSSGHNVIYIQQFHRVSDSTVKSNIIPLRGGLETILQLKTYTYDILRGDSLTGFYKKEYGFLSQEVREILPTITDTSKGLLLMDYDQITPLLTDATQELYYTSQMQKVIIDSLVKKVTSLENTIYGKEEILDIKLYQNQPNPFKDNTVIKYELPTEYTTAFIMIFNMNGAYIESHEIFTDGELTIEAETLEAGMYLYTLIVDNKEIDTKRMIIQQ